MLDYLYKGKLIGLRTSLKQLRAIVNLLMIFISYWFIIPKFLTVYYFLTAIIISALIADHQRSKKSLVDLRIKPLDLGIIIINNLYIAGIIMITGASQSPLIYVVLIPFIIFSAEYGVKIGILNYIGICIFLTLICVINSTLITLQTLAVPFAILITAGIYLSMVGALAYFQNHYNRKINRLLTRDELTRLYNRRFLKFSVLKAIKAEKPFGFILIDINFFKYYNDFWGHTAGDGLLISIAKILSKSVRSHDIVVRHSGDEFILILPESDQATVKKIIANIIQTIDSSHFPGEECFPDRKLSISYGFTFFPSGARNYQDLFTAADQALYRYKREHNQ
jgi:diguanylate cyclase (GGDEF)-like protein